MDQLYALIQSGDSEGVRKLLLEAPQLTSTKERFPALLFDKSVERDAYKFLGAYLGIIIGSMTPLHLAILLGQDAIALDIMGRTSTEDLNETFGGDNTALHLATLLGARDLVKALLERGASPSAVNGKGFTALDVVDDPEMTLLYSSTSAEGLSL